MKDTLEVGDAVKVQRPSSIGEAFGARIDNPKEGDRAWKITDLTTLQTEGVTYHIGFGWCTPEEWQELCQSDPRIAP